MSYRYKTVKRDGRTVLLHRWLMEQHLGRKLLRTEEVHHKNRDRFDNRIENLELTNTKDHQAEHHPPQHPVSKACFICNAEFTPHKTKRKRQQTCSWNCRNALIAVRRHGISVDVARARYCANVPRGGPLMAWALPDRHHKRSPKDAVLRLCACGCRKWQWQCRLCPAWLNCETKDKAIESFEQHRKEKHA